jgi:hypothetical protein
MANLTEAQIEQLWTSNGGDPSMAQTMAAIAMAESSGNPGAYNGNDSNGKGGTQVSAGLWQISTGTMSPIANWGDANVNAKAAVQKYQSQGLGAWGTYSSGAYQQYMQGAAVTDTSLAGGTNTGSGQDPAVAQYLESLYDVGHPNAPNAPSAVKSAYSTVTALLDQYGLGDLGAWAWDELVKGSNSDQVMLDLKQQPTYKTSVLGKVDAALAFTGQPAQSAAQIMSYKATVQQYAAAAGIQGGFMSDDEIAKLYAGGVSASEVSSRLTTAYDAANNADPQTKALLHSYFGVDTGNLAAYYLDPSKALPLLQQQITAAQIGTDAHNSNFGDITAAQASLLAQQGVTASQGQAGFAKIAPLTSLENAGPGQNPTVSGQQLIDYGFNGANQQLVTNAEDTRKAPFSGGGGPVTGTSGVSGAGYGKQ